MKLCDRLVQCTNRRYGCKAEETSSESEDGSDSSSAVEETTNPCKYVTYECQHILFLSSFQLSISLVFSLYCQFYHLAIVNLGLFLTSIIHWRKPELGLRRTVDMLMTLMNFLMHVFHSLNVNSMSFFICICGAILVFFLYYSGKKLSYNSYSTLCHLLIHTTGNMSALAFYYISKSKLIDHS
ncbi:conserved Plasmodium protein, unknown function [Plasmodium vivax]|uniref:Uncharacterized protein n=1 Tax=Plasmodium vivax TaxID=5855 RepID=A0A1G4GQX8_PLAVI|nr:conserved Plasmodium protein, unknown function [Plasmodium vivax]VUZ93130.1 conserved protein, unknown function [Plasmodium vivax]